MAAVRRPRHGFSVRHDEEGVRTALEFSRDFDFAQGVADCAGGLRHLAALPEVGEVGVVGFCLGGSIAYYLAAQNAAAAVVSFYGSAVPGTLELLDTVERPIESLNGTMEISSPPGHGTCLRVEVPVPTGPA